MIKQDLNLTNAHKPVIGLTPGFYRTRGGRKACVLTNMAPGEQALMGYIESKTRESHSPSSWSSSGKSTVNSNDLIEVWTDRRIVDVDLYVSLDSSGGAVISYNPPGLKDTVIGVKKISVRVEEGDTL